MIQVNDDIGDYVNSALKHNTWYKQYMNINHPMRCVMSSGINIKTYWRIRNDINETSKR